MTAPEKTTRKLGADRNEPAQKPRRHRSRSESRDMHEDRGTRQSKFGHSQHSMPSSMSRPSMQAGPVRRAGEHPPLLLNEHSSGPASQPVRLRYHRDGACGVFLAGTFNDWDSQRLALHASLDGGWEIDLCLPPGDYEYRFVVDGEWADDPLAERVVPNGFGGVNAVLSVPRG